MIKKKVQVWIYYRDPHSIELFFLILRTHQNFWQPVTGSLEQGETPEEAALREATEESGLLFQTNPFFIETFEFIKEDKKIQEFGFALPVAATLSSPPPIQMDSREHVAFRWVSGQEAIRTILYVSNQNVLKKILNAASQDALPILA